MQITVRLGLVMSKNQKPGKPSILTTMLFKNVRGFKETTMTLRPVKSIGFQG